MVGSSHERRQGLGAALRAYVVRDARVAASYWAALVLRLVDPFVALAGTWFYARLVPPGGPLAPYGGDYFGFALVGMAVMHLHGAVVTWPGYRLREEMLQGTLEALHASARGPVSPIVGSMLFEGGLAVLRATLLLVVGSLVGARWSVDLPALLCVAAATSLAFASWGLLAAAGVLVLQKATPVTWVLTVLTTVISGAFYPLSVMPEAVQLAARVLPATTAIEGLRRALLGGPGSAWESVLILLGFSAVCLPLGVLCVRLATRRARRRGALGTY